ncbi:hypothetical protein STEG23_037363, partial [Scotinomys teguina]
MRLREEMRLRSLDVVAEKKCPSLLLYLLPRVLRLTGVYLDICVPCACKYPSTGIRGGCEMPGVGSGNQIWVLCKSSCRKLENNSGGFPPTFAMIWNEKPSSLSYHKNQDNRIRFDWLKDRPKPYLSEMVAIVATKSTYQDLIYRFTDPLQFRTSEGDGKHSPSEGDGKHSPCRRKLRSPGKEEDLSGSQTELSVVSGGFWYMQK